MKACLARQNVASPKRNADATQAEGRKAHHHRRRERRSGCCYTAPPTGTRSSWYAYWNGLVTSKSTGQTDLQNAMIAAENMVRSGGRRAVLDDAVLSDDEFQTVQLAHYGRKTDPAAQVRAAKTLEECLDAIAAFKAITGLRSIASASPDDCGSVPAGCDAETAQLATGRWFQTNG